MTLQLQQLILCMCVFILCCSVFVSADQEAPTATVEKTPIESSSSAAPASPTPALSTCAPLFNFDASSSFITPDTPTASSPYTTIETTALAPFVLRVHRQVRAVGMTRRDTLHPMHRQEYDAVMSAGIQNGEQVEHTAVPAMTVSTSTLNLLVTAHYQESSPATTSPSSSSSTYRGLQFHVLPGPSFSRTLVDIVKKRGISEIGWEQSWHAVHDRRLSEGDDTTLMPNSETDLLLMPTSSPLSSPSTTPPLGLRLPGHGRLHHLRTMSGQQNENWILYTSGAVNEEENEAGVGKVQEKTAIYSFLVEAKLDKTQKQQQHDNLADDPTTSSINAHNIRLKVMTDFVVTPVEYGKTAVKPYFQTDQQQRNNKKVKLNHDTMTTEEIVDGETDGSTMSSDDIEELQYDLASQQSTSAAPIIVQKRYSRIVDFACYQLKKFIFLGVAYDDGFIRIYSRGGQLRNEIRTHNTTILSIAMSNWGSLVHSASGNGGGAKDYTAGLNGIQNGNQMLAYVTPEGIGIIRMARIHQDIDTYCKWEGSRMLMSGVDSGITSGHDISSITFDSASQSVMYVLSHTTRSVYVLSTKLGWWLPEQNRRNYDHDGNRLIQDGGNECTMLMQMTVKLNSAATAASSSLRHPHYSLFSLRNFLFVSTPQALLAYNATTIHLINEGEPGLVLQEEYPLDSAVPSTRRTVITHLIADRIEMLVAGTIDECSGRTCSSSPSPSSSSSTTATTSPHIHIFQLFLPSPDSRLSSISSWFGMSRTPLFVIGLLIIFAYQYFQRQKKLEKKRRKGEMDEDLDREEDEFERLQAIQRGMSGDKTPRQLDDLLSKHAKSNDDPFDEQQFMANFLAWKKGKEAKQMGGGDMNMRQASQGHRNDDPMLDLQNRRGVAKGGANAAPYMDLLAHERRQLNAHLARSRESHTSTTRKQAHNNSSTPFQTKPSSYLEFEQQRIEMRRILNQMDQTNQLDKEDVPIFKDEMAAVAGAAATAASSEYDQQDLLDDDPTDGMQYEQHGFDAQNYESDSYDPDDEEGGDLHEMTRDELPDDANTQQQQQQQQRSHSQSVRRRRHDSALEDELDDDDDDDGPTHHSAYDEYEYNHAQYSHSLQRQKPTPESLAAAAAKGDNTFLIDTLLDEGDDPERMQQDERHGVDGHGDRDDRYEDNHHDHANDQEDEEIRAEQVWREMQAHSSSSFSSSSSSRQHQPSSSIPINARLTATIASGQSADVYITQYLNDEIDSAQFGDEHEQQFFQDEADDDDHVDAEIDTSRPHRTDYTSSADVDVATLIKRKAARKD